MEKVIIGVDPHKLSATIEAIDQYEGLLGSGRFATDKAGFDAMLHYVNRWSNREWAVEGSLGVGRPLSQRQRIASVNRLHAPLAELTPGKSKKDLTALQAKAILANVRPRDLTGKTRRRIAASELANLMAIEKQMKELAKEMKGLVAARGSNLMDLPGVGPIVAARVLADVARFADRNRFASWTGTAPLDVSSGENNRHRLSRAGNRRMNRMIHIAATTQIRLTRLRLVREHRAGEPVGRLAELHHQ